MKLHSLIPLVCTLLLGVAVQALPTQNTHLEAKWAYCQAATGRQHARCPRNTVIVDPSPDHKNSSFTTIQAAIDSLPNDDTKHTILILAGNYTEQLNITRSGPVTLMGQTSSSTDQTKNTVNVIWASANKGGAYWDNAFTSVLTVAPNLNASLTGSGMTGFPVPPNTPFGNKDFRAYNINFLNTFSNTSDGPALAVSVSRANAGFYFCGFYSYQDTVYIGKLGNAYFYKNEIAGQTDFLYGFGTAYISESKLSLRGCGGGITAWKGTNTTFVNKYGVYISNSTIAAASAQQAPKMQGKCALGRDWNYLHKSVFMNCYLDASIRPSGYIPWSNSANPPFNQAVTNQTFMAEYASYGPGWDLQGRMNGNVTRVLNDTGVKPYRTPKDVFLTEDGQAGNIGWIDTQYYST